MILRVIHRRCLSYARTLYRVKVDNDGLPLTPTWSVKDLLKKSNSDSHISDEQLDHLFRLAQLRPPKDQAAREQLKNDMNELTGFIESIQGKEFGDTTPLSHIWQEGTGMTLRSDDTKTDGVRGIQLLDKAKRVNSPFYIVKGQHQEE